MNLDDAKMYALVHNRQKCECEDIYRLVQKHDTEANWNKAVNFKPKAGELIVYDVDDTHLAPRLKVGDGKTVVFDLPFFFEGAIAELSQKLDKEIIDRIKAVSDAIKTAAEDATLKSGRAVTLANSYTDNSVANEAAERARDVSTLSAEITRETTRALNAEDSLSTRIDNLSLTKLDKTGGTIEGTLNVKENLDVTGNLTVHGTATAVKTQSLLVVDNVIATNADKQELTTLLSGLALNKNANETYGLMYDPADNTVKFGQGTLSDTGVFTFNVGEGKPLAIRAQSTELNKDHLIKWDSTTNSFVDSGKTVTDFVPKIVPSGKYWVYCQRPSGIETDPGSVQMIEYTSNSVANTIAYRGGDGVLRGATAPLAQQNDLDLINRGELTEKLSDKLSTSNIGQGLSFSNDKVNANIAKIQDSDATEFTPDENGVVTIPNAGKTTSGLIKVDSNFGIAPVTFSSTPKGTIAVAGASDIDISKRTNAFKPITSSRLNLAVKAALTDDKRIGTETTDPTTFTDIEKDRACEVLGATRYTTVLTQEQVDLLF